MLFLEDDRNGALITPQKGDFFLFADLYLMDRADTPETEAALYDLSAAFGKRGLLIVMPDEEADNPFDSLVWSRCGLQYGYTVEPETDDTDYRFLKIYPPWSVPTHAVGRLPPQWTPRRVLKALLAPARRWILRDEARRAWAAS